MWVENVRAIIDVFSALLSPVIAITVAYIAYQQWKINASKESREVKAEKLNVYLVVKRFLSNIDATKSVDPKLFKEFEEASAVADFIFDSEVIDWLFDVSGNASSWLDIDRIIRESPHSSSNKWLEKEEIYKASAMDKLETAHCELLDIFKHKVMDNNA